MKLLTAMFCLCCLAAAGHQQKATPKGYFSAIVVKDLAASTKWYQSVLTLEVKKTMMDQPGFKIAILESSDILLELMEQVNSVPRQEVLDSKPAGTNVQGFSKIGFKVADMDAFLKHLADVRMTIPKIWTDQATGRRNFLVSDPDGNLVQFFE